MNEVLTPDGWGQVLRTQSAHGRTSYLVKGAGFEGWYDGLEVTADFDAVQTQMDTDIDHDNDTVLPYPSRPQGPGWDGTTSTIPPDIDPNIEMDGNSDSLTGEPTSDDAVGADLDSDFEPNPHLAGRRAHRVHFASLGDPILDVADLPDESPTGLENSPINPDGVSTDDLFERAASYDRLVIEDDFSFMRFAADDDSDDKKKNQHERGGGNPFAKDDDDSDDDDGDSDDDSGADSSDDDDSSSSDGDSSSSDGGDGGDGGGGHTAAVAAWLSTTADLHFLANLCVCAEELPLHSKSEHRELLAEGGLKQKRRKNQPMGNKPLKGHHGDSNPKTPAEAGYEGKGVGETLKPTTKGRKRLKVERPLQHAAGDVEGVTPQQRDLDKLEERYRQDQLFHPAPLDLVDHSDDDADNTDLYNKLSSIKTAAPAQPPQPTQIESQIEQLMQFWAVDNNGWWHWTGSQSDLALLNQMQQQMMAVGMPSGQPGAMQAQSKTAAPAALAPLLEAGAGEAAAGGAAEGAAAEGGSKGMLGNLMGGGVPGGGVPSPAKAMGDVAGALNAFNGGADAGVAHHGIPFRTYNTSFHVEANTPPRWREYLQTVASDKLVALAAWRDVVDKSKRLRSEGAITVEVFKPEVITAYIQGDHGRYYTTVQRLGSVQGLGRQNMTSTQVSGWSCECEWGHWAWIRKRSFVGRMCSHAYALFSEMRSLDAQRRRGKGKPLGAGKFASTTKFSWTRDGDSFVWVTDDPAKPTAAITSVGSAWGTKIWPDGTAEDALSLGVFMHSERARRAISRVITAHMKFADQGDVDMVGGGGDFPPGESTGYDNTSPYADEGAPEPVLDASDNNYDEGPGPGIWESSKTSALSAFAEAKDGDDDEGPEEEDNGIEEEADPDDDESLDEEIAEDEDDSNDGQDDAGSEPEPDNDEAGDGGHYEPHKRDDSDDDEGTDNPGDESDDDHVEKQSSVTELQQQYGLAHLAGASYSPRAQANLVAEGQGKQARNRGDLNLTGTHYEAANSGSEAPEDTLAFLF